MEFGSTDTQPLCNYCTALFPIRTTTSRTRVQHHPTPINFLESLKQTACALCTLVQKEVGGSLLVDEGHRTEGQHDATQIQFYVEEAHYACANDRTRDDYEGPDIAWMSITVEFHIKKRREQYDVTLTIATCSNRNAPPTPAVWSTPSISTTVDEKHSVIKRWLQDCENNHTSCRVLASMEPYRLPKCLIRITLIRGVEALDLDVRLVSTVHEAPIPTRYAALSHCWGKVMPLRTTKANLNLHLQRIPIEATPRTFLEAIQLCCSLGIQYLWIDSLCIVQDDAGDWSSEAARMKDIYANATITIAASYASDCTEGCFVDNAENALIPKYLSDVKCFNVTSKREGSVGEKDKVARDSLLAVRVYAHHGVGRRSRETLLSRRGWTLQEQVLSRRVVHCIWPEIHWQCCSMYGTEAGLSLDLYDISGRSRISTIHEIESSLPTLDFKAREQTLQDVWRVWMVNYSRRRFSFVRDQNAALAGLVQHYCGLTGYHDILGCWEETICRDLAWHTEKTIRSPEPTSPGMPSWTWLSRNQDIDMDSYLLACEGSFPTDAIVTDHAELVGKRIQWEGAPLFTSLTAAELTFKAFIKTFQLRTSPEAMNIIPPPVNFNDDVRIPSQEVHFPWCGMAKLDEHPGATELQYCNGTYTCMLLRSCMYPSHKSKFETFLILEQVDHVEGGRMESPLCYKRLGLGGVNMENCRSATESYFENAEERLIKLI